MDLAFEIDHWIGSAIADPLERTTLAALRITAGPNRIPITEVEDTLARSVRPHIHVAVYPLANWLLVNWWRLRWEPEPRAVSQPSFDWLQPMQPFEAYHDTPLLPTLPSASPPGAQRGDHACDGPGRRNTTPGLSGPPAPCTSR